MLIYVDPSVVAGIVILTLIGVLVINALTAPTTPPNDDDNSFEDRT